MTPVSTARCYKQRYWLLGLICSIAGASFAEAQPTEGVGLRVPEMVLPGEVLPETIPEGTIPYGTITEGSMPGLPAEMMGGEVLSPGVPGIDGTYDMCACQPAVVESSGTWLERGFWYATADAVILARSYSGSNTPWAVDTPTLNRLMMRGRDPGRDIAVRGTLGRFLFRDEENRTHSMEFTAFGGGGWDQINAVESATQQLGTSGLITGFNQAFNNSRRQEIAYTSELNSFELNYRVKDRIGRDLMVLKPSGEWVRRGAEGWTREFLAGLRYFNLAENWDWTADDVQLASGDEDGRYLVKADNEMIGFQLGTGLTHQNSRWSLSALAKGGVFVNNATGSGDFSLTNNPNLGFSNRMQMDEMSFVGEAQILGRWYLRPNFSVRAAYEALYISSVALAPDQVNFIPNHTHLATPGDPIYHGASFGFEGYW